MTARITYNSVSVNFDLSIDGARTAYRETRNINQSASGKSEIIHLYGSQEITATGYFGEDDYRDFLGWWAWARQGRSFAFAEDNTNQVATTLDGSAASGQKTIPLTSTTDISAGDFFLIRDEDDPSEFEVVEISTVNAGVSIIAIDNLIYEYTSGDTFRHLTYWDDVICLNTQFNPQRTKAIEGQPNYYQYTFEFRENI